MRSMTIRSLFTSATAMVVVAIVPISAVTAANAASCDNLYQFMFQASTFDVSVDNLNGAVFSWAQSQEANVPADIPSEGLEAPIFNVILHTKTGNTDNIHLSYNGTSCQWYQALMTLSTTPDIKAIRSAFNKYDSKLMLTSLTIVEPTTDEPSDVTSTTTSATTVTSATTTATSTASTATDATTTATNATETTTVTSELTTVTSDITTVPTNVTTEDTTTVTSSTAAPTETNATETTTTTATSETTTVTPEPVTNATSATTETTAETITSVTNATSTTTATETVTSTTTTTTTTEATTTTTTVTAPPTTTAIPLSNDARWFVAKFAGEFNMAAEEAFNGASADDVAPVVFASTVACTICNFTALQNAMANYYYIGASGLVSINGISAEADASGNFTIGNFSFYGTNADKNAALMYYESATVLADQFGIQQVMGSAYESGYLPVPVDPHPPTAPTTTAGPNKGDDADGSNNRGTIIVIVCACAGGVAIIGAAIACFLRRRRQSADKHDYETESLQEYRQVNYY